MKNKTKYIILSTLLIISIIVLAASIILTSYLNYLWWSILIASILSIALYIITLYFYLQHTEFICPKCNQQFKPSKTNIIFAMHTLNKRHLHCPHCNKNTCCKEVFIEDITEKTANN